jgi:hypothetical protein
MIIENSTLTPSTKFILENMHSTSDTNTVTMTAKVRNRHSSDATLEFHSDGYGDFYLFGGHLMAFALIQADSFCSAYEIFLEEFVPCDEIESDEDVECGTFDGSGGFYNGSTTSDIVSLDPYSYTFDFKIKSN